MAKFLNLTEMPGLHLPWLDVALPEPDEEIDYLSQNLSQCLSLTDLRSSDVNDEAGVSATKKTNKKESADSGLPFFPLDTESTTDERSRVSVLVCQRPPEFSRKKLMKRRNFVVSKHYISIV